MSFSARIDQQFPFLSLPVVFWECGLDLAFLYSFVKAIYDSVLELFPLLLRPDETFIKG